MKYFIFMLIALLGLVVVDSASATGGRLRGRSNNNASITVSRQRGNSFVQKQVIRDNHVNARVVERIVVDNRHQHNNARIVERVVVDKPVYRDVVVERVIVDNHGHRQTVRTVERIRVR
jgi:hypothetical protein